MCTFLLCRHGQTDWNAAQRIQGHIDVPLNAVGRAQAEALAPTLRDRGIVAVWASDLSRAVATAEILARGLGLPVQQDADLREVHLGEAQGMDRAQLEATLPPELVARWRGKRIGDADVRYPGGESAREVVARARAALRRAAAGMAPEAAILVVSHGGLISRLLHSLSPPETPAISVGNTEIHRVRYQADGERFSRCL